MADNTIGGIPATIVFTLIISFFAFFASITCVALYYYKRNPRRLERLRQLEQAVEARETIPLGTWAEAPILWEVWADKHPKSTSEWKDLLVRLSSVSSSVFFYLRPRTCSQPLNLTYEQDQPAARELPIRQSAALPAPSGRGTGWGSLGDHIQPPESNDGPSSQLDIASLSVFIAMPSPHAHLPSELGGEFAIGTAEVLYPHPERFHP
jgi:hypothetical protein